MSTKSHYAAHEGTALAGAKVLIVETRYYDEIAEQLLVGARAVLDAASVHHDIVTVPGALEIPAAIAFAERTRDYDGFVTLGCVIRGATTHYEIVSEESARALMDLTVDRGIALGNGILTVENEDQALERADPARLDKGGGAAAACLAMIGIKRRFAR